MTLKAISGVPVEQVLAQARAAVARGLPELPRPAPMGSRGPAIVVAAGPSVRDAWNDIKTLSAMGVPVWSVKGMWREMARQGIPCAASVLSDPHPSQVAYTVGAPDMTWFVSSLCHEWVFDALADKTVLWHAPIQYHPEVVNAAMPPGAMLIHGGSGTGSRAVRVCAVLGHSPIHLFGFDCCLTPGQPSHAYTLARELDTVIEATASNGRVYRAPLSWLTDAADLAFLHRGGSVRLVVHGPGLLAASIAGRGSMKLPPRTLDGLGDLFAHDEPMRVAA